MPNSNLSLDVNDVNGSSNRESSSGRDNHRCQVVLDRHQATAHKNKAMLNIGTWNVRSMWIPGKPDNIKREMERLKVNIKGLSETRWTGNNQIISDQHKVVYSGGEKHEFGVAIILDKETSKSFMTYWPISDRVLMIRLKGQPFDIDIIQAYAPTSTASEEELEKFYEQLETVKAQCKSQNIIVVMGDFNAVVGSERTGNIVGPHGLGERNNRGSNLVEWAIAHNMRITNAWFKQHPRRKWTWLSPDQKTRNQIDYIMIGERFKNAIKQSKNLSRC